MSDLPEDEDTQRRLDDTRFQSGVQRHTPPSRSQTPRHAGVSTTVSTRSEADFRTPSFPARTERIKLLATYLNTIAAGFAVTGVIGPVASYLYGTTAQMTRPAWQLGCEVLSLVLFSVILHLLARRVLGRLDQ